MKLTKKLLSLILAIVMLSTAFVPGVYAVNEEEDISSVNEYKSFLANVSMPVISTENFGVILNVLKTFYTLLTGTEPEVNKFNVTVDDMLLEITDEICESSGLDLGLIAENVPDINVIARALGERFEIDTTAFREARYAKRDEYLANGNEAMASLCHAIGAFMSIIEECEIYTEKTNEANVYRVMLHVVYEDGVEETHDAGLYINTKTGECYNKNGAGMFSSGYNFNFKEMVVYTTVDCWMRNFGFCLFYDVAANMMPISYSYVTRRFKFEYDGLEWMIQIWKGNYFISNGGEVGIYSREPGKNIGSFYNCATPEQELPMSMDILIGDKLLLSRPLQKHWWISGFHLSNRRYIPSLLTLKTTIVMTDEEMLNAFTAAIDANVMDDVTYTVDGLKVNLVW